MFNAFSFSKISFLLLVLCLLYRRIKKNSLASIHKWSWGSMKKIWPIGVKKDDQSSLQRLRVCLFFHDELSSRGTSGYNSGVLEWKIIPLVGSLVSKDEPPNYISGRVKHKWITRNSSKKQKNNSAMSSWRMRLSRLFLAFYWDTVTNEVYSKCTYIYCVSGSNLTNFYFILHLYNTS